MYSVVLMMAVSTGGEVPDCHRHHSCHGGYTCCGGVVVSTCYGGCYGGLPVYGCCGGIVVPGGMKKAEEIQKKPEEKKPEQKKPEGGAIGVTSPNQTRLVVKLPAVARLNGDSARTEQPTERVMTFLQMSPDRECQYVVRGEVVQDGKTVRVDKTVTLRGGAVVEVSLGETVATE